MKTIPTQLSTNSIHCEHSSQLLPQFLVFLTGQSLRCPFYSHRFRCRCDAPKSINMEPAARKYDFSQTWRRAKRNFTSLSTLYCNRIYFTPAAFAATYSWVLLQTEVGLYTWKINSSLEWSVTVWPPYDESYSKSQNTAKLYWVDFHGSL